MVGTTGESKIIGQKKKSTSNKALKIESKREWVSRLGKYLLQGNPDGSKEFWGKFRSNGGHGV